MTPEQIALTAYIITRALEAAARSIAAFQEVNGRPPTLEEWKALEARWRSPEEIEAAPESRPEASGLGTGRAGPEAGG